MKPKKTSFKVDEVVFNDKLMYRKVLESKIQEHGGRIKSIGLVREDDDHAKGLVTVCLKFE